MTITKERIAEIAKDVAAEVVRSKGSAIDRTEHYKAMVTAITQGTGMGSAPHPKAPKGIQAAQYIRSIAAARGNMDLAVKFAEHEFGDCAVTKTLQASDLALGGALIPTEFSSELIELLTERAIVRSMGPRIVPMTTGSIQIPKITGGATASYIGETQNIATSEQEFGQINLVWKKLAVIVPISNDLLKFSAFGADAIVRDDSLNAMVVREDQAFLRGDGTQHTPKGLYSWVPAANVFTANATVNLANVTADVTTAILKLREANVSFSNVGWLWAPRTELWLRQVRDGNGNFAFKEEMDKGTFFGFKFGNSTNVPINLSGTDSEVYLIDFADVIIGEAGTIEVMASDQAPYWDGSALQSAYSRDLTLLRLIAHHDLGVRHEESLVRIDAVKWGA